MNTQNRALKPHEIQGVYTALITPMNKGDGLSNPINYEMMYTLIDDQVRAGVNGIVFAGTTGQSATLSPKEHADLVENVFKYTNKHHPTLQFIVGAGSNCTREAINLSVEIERRIGPSTFLHVTGYYNNPPQKGLARHFEAITQSIGPESNILLYNVPSRTKSEIEVPTVMYLSRNPKIVGIKDASGDIEHPKKILQQTDPERFVVLSGEDDLVSPIMKLGGRGVISASANIAPRYFVELTGAALKNNHSLAEKIQEEVTPLVKAVFSVKNPIPLAHIFNTELRLPLIKLPRIQAELDNIVDGYGSEKLGIDIRRYRSN